MYTEHFKLKKLPFENVPDPTFFFNRGNYGQIHHRIKNSLMAGRGLTIVTGPIGSGKTTLSQMIKSGYSDNLQLIWMAEPPESSIDLFRFVIQELGLKTSISERVFILRDIRKALLNLNASGKKCLMVIDESHLMTNDLIDGVRILNNLEEGPVKLLQILLLGQMEILQILKKPEMKAFMQRISSLETIGKMKADGIRQYIAHRIKVAGGQPTLFTETGWEAIVIASGTGGGIPRVINSLCDRALNIGFERGKPAVDMEDVSTVAEEMGIFKDLFHYKIAVENRKKNPEAPVSEKKQKPASLSQTPVPADQNPAEKTPADLKTPLGFLLFSLVMLGFSIIFYFQRI